MSCKSYGSRVGAARGLAPARESSSTSLPKAEIPRTRSMSAKCHKRTSQLKRTPLFHGRRAPYVNRSQRTSIEVAFYPNSRGSALRLTDWSLAARLWCCSAAHSEIRILIFASDYDLRVDLWQRLGRAAPLWSTCYNWSNAIHEDPNAHIDPVGNKTSLCACRSDLSAGSPRRRLNRRRLNWRRLNRRGLSGRRLGRSRLNGRRLLNALGRRGTSAEVIES